MTMLVQRFTRLLRHVREGTLFRRIAWGVSHRLDRIRTEGRRDASEKRKHAWESLAESDGEICAQVGGGAKLKLTYGNKLAEMIYLQDFERSERMFLQRYLQVGDVFVDVGANIGLFTVIAGRCVGPEGAVIAFEPAVGPRACLFQNVKLNCLKNVIIEEYALSDTEDSMIMFVPHDGHDAWGSLGAPIEGADVRTESVLGTTWDGYVRIHFPRRQVAMMKIDVEGWELRVLMGGKEFFSSPTSPLLQVEFTDAAAASAGASCAALYDKLVEFGYAVCHFDTTRNALVPEGRRSSYPYVNLYATKNLASVNTRLASGQSLIARTFGAAVQRFAR